MDDKTFDRLVRALALPGSRRRLLAGFAAGALGLAGFERAVAATCRPAGSGCREHANCCSRECGAKDAKGRRQCACRGGECTAPTTTSTTTASPAPTTTSTTTASPATTTSTTTVQALLGFGTVCAANSQCSSRVCSCHRGDCVGGGECAELFTDQCSVAADVETPSGYLKICASGYDFFDCADVACQAGQACQKTHGFCMHLAQP